MANPFVFVELSTDDPAKAKAFYKKVLNWKYNDMKMGPGPAYTMLDVGKGTGGGIQQSPMPGMPPAWLAYVEVDSVKATMAKAEKAGAHIVLEFQELPGMGALGIFVDPTGAPLGVWEHEKKQPKKASAKKAAPKKTKTKKAPAKKVKVKKVKSKKPKKRG